jgi:glycerol-1-phosphate dehydrogenase [NAD(P)+]
MGIAGSSRPCSGSEHQFSHALDMICEKPALHGEQCGVGTILMTYLHGKDWERVRDALKVVKAPVNSKELGIDDSYIIKALTMAHSIRDRYTILRSGLSEESAIDLAKKTGVIQ